MILKYALRSIARRKRESFLLVLVVFISSYVILAQAAQRRGVEDRARKILVESLSGEFLIYRSAKGGINVLEAQLDEMDTFRADATRLAEAGRGVPGVSLEPRLRFGGLVSSGNESMGLNLQALSPSHLERLANSLDFKEGGLDTGAADGVIISDAVAKELHVTAGDQLVVLATNREGYMADDLLRVTGVFRAKGVSSFLTPIGFLPYPRGAAMLNLDPGETTELVVSLPGSFRGDRAEAARAAAERVAPGLKVASWQDTAPLFQAIISVWRGSGAITQAVFCALSFLLLLNVVLMKVHHRRRETGTLLAMGYGRGWVTSQVTLEFLLISWAGFTLALLMVGSLAAAFGRSGIPIASEAMQTAYMGTRIYPRLLAADIMAVVTLLSVVTAAAVALPMMRYRNVEPAKLLRTAT